jgi:hypothetical protein
VLSSGPGDVDLALLGTANGGIAGTGRVAEVTFRVKALDDAGLSIKERLARDSQNRPIAMAVTEVRLLPPARTRLGSIFPNPFPGTTMIQLALKSGGLVRLGVYDLQGREVRSLVNGYQLAGERLVTWDGRDNQGSSVSAGVYMIRMEAGGAAISRRVTLIR